MNFNKYYKLLEIIKQSYAIPASASSSVPPKYTCEISKLHVTNVCLDSLGITSCSWDKYRIGHSFRYLYLRCGFTVSNFLVKKNEQN